MLHFPSASSCVALSGRTIERLASKYVVKEIVLIVYYIHTHLTLSENKVGFKPAGGIRTSKDVLQWMTLMKEELGDNYLTPDLFRIGASALLNDIERNLANYATGGYFLAEEMPMA